jgi:hypothetical protein
MAQGVEAQRVERALPRTGLPYFTVFRRVTLPLDSGFLYVTFVRTPPVMPQLQGWNASSVARSFSVRRAPAPPVVPFATRS